jgi:hypothetical protein
MHAVSATDFDGNCPRCIFSRTVILSSSKDEYTVTSYTETGEWPLTLLTDVSMDRHKVFSRVDEDNP